MADWIVGGGRGASRAAFRLPLSAFRSPSHAREPHTPSRAVNREAPIADCFSCREPSLHRWLTAGRALFLTFSLGALAVAMASRVVADEAGLQGGIIDDAGEVGEVEADAHSEALERQASLARLLESPVPGISEERVLALQTSNERLLELGSLNEARERAIEDAEAARDRSMRDLQRWDGFEPNVVFSVLDLDEIEAQRATLRGRLAASNAAESAHENEIRAARARLRDAEAARRRANEALGAADSEERAVAQFELEEAVVAEELERGFLAMVETRLSENGVWGEKAGFDLALQDKMIREARGKVLFTQQVLDDLLAGIDSRKAELRVRQQTAQQNLTRFESEEVRARAAFERAAQERGEDALASLERRVVVAEAEAAAARAENANVSMLHRLAEEEARAWQLRFELYGDQTRAERVATLRELEGLRTTLRGWVDLVALESEAWASPRSSRADDLPDALTARLEAAAETKSQLARELVENMSRVLATVDRVVDVERARLGERELRERLSDGIIGSFSWFPVLWNREVMVVGEVGVTFGKIVTALFFFSIGLWVALAVSRRFEALLTGSFHYGLAQARTVKRWLLALIILILLLISLHLVNIPLTAFAFLGGALAIGVGFGTKTLIQNLISGLMVLGERKIRVGDTIEVRGMLGEVSSIDLRSTTVRAFDGVESVIPNSFLIEEQVINWTHSDKEKRRTVVVGVAYGTSTRLVADVLLECACRHGKILAKPAPDVLFTDFGDSSLDFELRFWVDMGSGASGPAVESDLRHMIAKAFEEAGIEVPFPQRDLHLKSGFADQAKSDENEPGRGAAGVDPNPLNPES